MEYKGIDACVLLQVKAQHNKVYDNEIKNLPPSEKNEIHTLIVFHNRVRAKVLNSLLDREKEEGELNPAVGPVLFFPPMSQQTAQKIQELCSFPAGLTEAPEIVYNKDLKRLNEQYQDTNDPEYDAKKAELDDWLRRMHLEAKPKVLEYKNFEKKYCKTPKEMVEDRLFRLGIRNYDSMVTKLGDQNQWPSHEEIQNLQIKWGTPLIANLGGLNKLGGDEEIEFLFKFIRPENWVRPTSL